MPINVADRIMRNRHWLDQFSNGLHKQMSDELKEAQKALLDELMRPDLDKLTRKHHKKLLGDVTRILGDAYGEFPEIMENGMFITAKHEYYDVANTLRQAAGRKRIPVTAKNSGLPTEAIKELQTMPIGGSLLEDWVKKQYVNAEMGIRSVFNQSLIRGLSMPRTAKLLKDRIGMSNNEANVLARTGVMEASNRALKHVYKDHEDLIDGYEFLATLDNSTCVVCGPLDGKTKKRRGELEQPPLHPQCRCLISPVVGLEGLDEAQRFETVRDPKTGRIIHKEKISGKTKYSEWFDRQDEDFQRQALGKTRFELYRQGRLKLGQMSDATSGRILTLKELEKKYKIDTKISKKITEEVREERIQYAMDECLKVQTKTGNEMSRIIDLDTGDELAPIVGDFNSVEVSSQIKLFEEGHNYIQIHNHPQSMPPSRSDLIILLNQEQMKQSIITSTRYDFKIIKEKNAKTLSTKKDFDKINKDFSQKKAELKLKKWDKIFSETKDGFYCSWGVQMDTIKYFQGKYGYKIEWKEKK